MDYKELVKNCLKGKSEAQKKLYDLFAADMLGVCYRYTKSTADAEDVLQEGFIKVFRNLQHYREEGELGAWVRRIMVNSALNYLKQSKRYSTELLFEEDHLHPVSTENPMVFLQAKELADLIRQLPTGCQTIFNLHVVEGFTHVEIGEMLGIHTGTSRSQYARARTMMVAWIEKGNETIKQRRYAGK
ncbi:RNA polymerase sigma factor [Parafilimonas sp.]|uniref:RNA polymerase sigma factor n=1 Tax=Parafilimonas sp. TaxID=1969739 RepID=UPI0039E34E86